MLCCFNSGPISANGGHSFRTSHWATNQPAETHRHQVNGVEMTIKYVLHRPVLSCNSNNSLDIYPINAKGLKKVSSVLYIYLLHMDMFYMEKNKGFFINWHCDTQEVKMAI